MGVLLRFLFALTLVLGLWLFCGAGAETQRSRPFQGVEYVHRVETAPHPIAFYVVILDLANPHIRFQTTEANGDAPRDTWTETTRDFVKRTRAQIGVNASFFVMDHKPHTTLLGLAASGGKIVSKWAKGGFTQGVNISDKNVVTFFERAEPDPTGYAVWPRVTLYNAVTGDCRIVREGVNLTKAEGDRHPRTGIGLTGDNKLLLVVVDGRQPSYSVGMTYYELAQLMLEYGARDALNLDGGGSSTLVFADPEPHVVNIPTTLKMPEGVVTHPRGVERKVGNNIAVFAAPAAGGS